MWIDPESLTVAVYDRTAPKTWERRAILETSHRDSRLAAEKAFAGAAGQPNGHAQADRHDAEALNCPADRLMPTMSAQAASRILDRILSETSAVELSAI